TKPLVVTDLHSGRAVKEFDRAGEVEVVFSPDGNRLLAADWQSALRAWDVARWQPRSHAEGHVAQVQSLRFLPGGRLLASVDADCAVYVWDLKNGQPQRRVKTGSPQRVALSRDGRLLAWDERDFSSTPGDPAHTVKVNLLETGTGKVLQSFRMP